MCTRSTPRLGFIGPGTVGGALARSLAVAGYSVSLFGRRPERLRHVLDGIPGGRRAASAQQLVDISDVVFVTVPDDAIRATAESLTWGPRKGVVHCSGASSIDLLAHATEQGAAVGVFHPLQSFATPEQAVRNIPGSAFGVEASSEALLAALQEMAVSLGGTPLTVSGDKAIYHASAVIASNYLVALLEAASGLWRVLGLSQEEGLRALLPLVRGTIENLETIGLPDALTGPIARGDVGTIEQHLSALTEVAPDLLPLYKELARRAIPIARAKGGLGAEAADRLLAILDLTDRGGHP